jgi:uncharacterized protein
VLSPQEKRKRTILRKYGGFKGIGEKAAATTRLRHGSEFHKEIGKIGGKNGRGPEYRGGFAGNRELASEAGRKGGAKSRRKN